MNLGSGLYHRVVDVNDINDFTYYKLGMLRHGSLRNVAMNLVTVGSLVESVRVIGHEEAEPLISTPLPGNHGFEGKRTLMLDVKFNEEAIGLLQTANIRRLEGFDFKSQFFNNSAVMMRAFVYADIPFKDEEIVYSQKFYPAASLEFNPNVSLIPYVMMGWTPQLGQRRGQVKRDSRWKV